MKIRYFDHAATTPVRSEVLNSMLPFFGTEFGNPSSMYTIGRSSRRAVEEARIEIARAINAEKNEIYFTSCGSESDNMIIKGIMLANKDKGKHMITSKIEHPAVLNTCKWLEKNGFDVTYLNVDSNGKISLQELEKSIRSDTIMISIMYANNEIGTIQPINEICRIAKENSIIFHIHLPKSLMEFFQILKTSFQLPLRKPFALYHSYYFFSLSICIKYLNH